MLDELESASYIVCVTPWSIYIGSWSSPTVNGTRPPPGRGFALTSIDEHRAILHGGYDAGHKCRSSDVYIIDFQTMVGVHVLVVEVMIRTTESFISGAHAYS